MPGGGETEVSPSISDYFRLAVAGAFGTPSEIANEVQRPLGGSPLSNVAQGADIAAQNALMAVGNTRTAQQAAGFVEAAGSSLQSAASGAGDRAREILVAVVVVAAIIFALKR